MMAPGVVRRKLKNGITFHLLFDLMKKDLAHVRQDATIQHADPLAWLNERWAIISL
jgi:hypothetical protein